MHHSLYNITIKNTIHVRNFFAINFGVAGEKHEKTSGKPYRAITNRHLALSAMEHKGGQR